MVGYVYVDIDQAQRDIGGYVNEAKEVVARAMADGTLKLPAGTYLKWTGQYEQLEEMAARMKLVVPLTLLIIIVLLFLQFRNVIEVLIILLSIPFALVGSVWLMWLLDYRVSTAVWVGIIALVGLAAQTGIVMIVYIDNAFHRRQGRGAHQRPRGHHRGAHGGHRPARAAEADDGLDDADRARAAAVGHELRLGRHEADRCADGGRSPDLGVPHAGDHPSGRHLLAAGAAPLGAAVRSGARAIAQPEARVSGDRSRVPRSPSWWPSRGST